MRKTSADVEKLTLRLMNPKAFWNIKFEKKFIL